MRALRRYLPLILALGAVAGLLPALAQGVAPPMTGSFTAVDDHWNAAGGGSTVTIGKGGTVSFGYPSGATQHNVVFDSKAPSCTQTAGSASGAVPPLPHTPTSPGWSGTCTFADLGDYKFHCGLHGAAMSGTVKVVADVGSTSGPAARKLKLKQSQRGTSVKGSIEITRAGASLDVRAFARRQDLGETTTGQQRRVGRFVRFSLAAKRANFKVKLSRKARRALSRNGKLRITLTITVTPTAGAKYTKQKTVALRPSS